MGVSRTEITHEDIRTAENFIRGVDLNLRAPDAIHIAIARRLNAVLATLDLRMRKAASAFGIDVADI